MSEKKKWVEGEDELEEPPVPWLTRGELWALQQRDKENELNDIMHLACPNYPNCDTEGCGEF
tara:strand:- start:10 stop:195 length:186 start_codon:yes stop_codon:yes gene_type:complete